MGREDMQRMRLIAGKMKMAVMVLAVCMTMMAPAAEVSATMVKTIATDTIELASEKELEQDTDLSNSYRQLEEKYQREKEFSRSVIYTLIFIIAILIVININIIVYYRRKSDDNPDDSFEEQKIATKPEQEIDTTQIKKNEEIPEKEEIPEEETPKKVKEVPNKASAKVEVTNKFEVFDFNDED